MISNYKTCLNNTVPHSYRVKTAIPIENRMLRCDSITSSQKIVINRDPSKIYHIIFISWTFFLTASEHEKFLLKFWSEKPGFVFINLLIKIRILKPFIFTPLADSHSNLSDSSISKVEIEDQITLVKIFETFYFNMVFPISRYITWKYVFFQKMFQKNFKKFLLNGGKNWIYDT